ncbi:hypothetical protein NE237_011436 [Protea cynaroides]|uniref:Nodulin-related protein 1 n=1 Tax=Protea cynaroides TaxID=273540 RepID=A0A9Q0GXX8_9MAGN|nr:hypothetical protein NE237_011436 [Protea cynaroides]
MESRSHNEHKTHDHKHRPSNSELLSSAKVIAEAAKAGLHHETDKIDKGKVAAATADLMGAASYFGKLEEKGVGKYVGKAEQYLHHYNSSHSSTTTTTSSAHSTTTTTTHSHSTASESHSESGGYGDYIKMAQGFLSSGGESHSESGGYGDYIKMAQGFIKKH